MLELIEQIGIGTVGSLCGGLVTYAILKITFRKEKLFEYAKDFLTEISSNTDMQKKIYQIGGILGNGIAAGTGLGRKGGKFGMNDIISTLAARFLGIGEQRNESQNSNSQLPNLG